MQITKEVKKQEKKIDINSLNNKKLKGRIKTFFQRSENSCDPHTFPDIYNSSNNLFKIALLVYKALNSFRAKIPS